MAPDPLKRLTRVRRRPPFALVLIVLAAAIGGAFVLLGGSGGAGGDVHRPPTLIGSGRGRACVTAHASAAATAKTTIRLRVSHAVPISATGEAKTARGSVTVRLSQRIVEHGSVARPLSVRRTVVVARRACSRRSSDQAARGAALTAAYHAALTAARPEARAQAQRELARLVARVRPATLAGAQRKVDGEAQAAAAVARLALGRRAAADAASKARAS
jgi:hypothetical protein